MMPVKRRCDHCDEFKLFAKLNNTCDDCLTELRNKQYKKRLKQIEDHRVINYIRSRSSVKKADVINNLHLSDYDWKCFLTRSKHRLINANGKWSVKVESERPPTLRLQKIIYLPLIRDKDGLINEAAALTNASMIFYHQKQKEQKLLNYNFFEEV